MYLVRYIVKTFHLGMKFTSNQIKGFECYVNTNFCESWDKQFASFDPSTANSRSGWIIFYADCLVSQASKCQTQCALFATEAEYIAMLSSLREVIHIIGLIAEIRNSNFQVICLMWSVRYLRIMKVP